MGLGRARRITRLPDERTRSRQHRRARPERLTAINRPFLFHPARHRYGSSHDRLCDGGKTTPIIRAIRAVHYLPGRFSVLKPPWTGARYRTLGKSTRGSVWCLGVCCGGAPLDEGCESAWRTVVSRFLLLWSLVDLIRSGVDEQSATCVVAGRVGLDRREYRDSFLGEPVEVVADRAVVHRASARRTARSRQPDGVALGPTLGPPSGT
ncbi:MAG: hypothetical protein QOG53_2179 [Frankiales bacterium]|nr:hypothetical protein [Frankiales bacterium]